jgi:hypothetical protein
VSRKGQASAIASLAAAAITDVTPKSTTDRALEMKDEELMREIINSPGSRKARARGVKTMDELLLRIATPKALPAPVVEPPGDDQDLLR